MKKRLLFLIILPAIVLISTGAALGLNGFFGGGSSIPEDSFSRGLVGYWGMDEGYGATAYDGSNYGNTGTLYGGMATTSWTSGKLGGALKFDGVDDYVDAGNGSSLNPTTAITIETWVNPSSIIGGATNPVIDKWNVWGLRMQDTFPSYIYTTGCASAGDCSVNVGTISTNTWTHLVLTFNGTDIVSYKNGVEVNRTTKPGTIQTSGNNLWIGHDQSGGTQYSKSLIDEVRIYNRALSAAEVKYHYNRGGPVAQWKFDEGSGSVAYDTTENNNDGTLKYMSTSTNGGWINGKLGTALSFDGADNYVQVAHSDSLNIANAITIGFWTKRGSSQNSAWSYPIIRGAGGSYSVNFNRDDNLYRFYSNLSVGGWQSVVSSRDSSYTPVDTWVHIVTTYESSTGQAKFYINGELKNTDTKSGTISTGSFVSYLGGNGGSESYNGLLDDMRVYNYARTPEEIRLDYNAGFGAKFGYTGASCANDPASCMSNGLAGYWNFDERYGASVADGSGNANTGTMYGGMATTSWTTGKKSGALNFDGVDDYINLGTPTSLQITSELTFEGWVKYNSFAANYNPVIVSNYWRPTLWRYNVSGGVFAFTVDEGGGNTWNAYGATVVALNTWYHVVGTFSLKEGKMKVYVNGVLDGQVDKTTAINLSGSAASIGTNDVGAGQQDFTNGSIDEVRIYNRALSAEEVRYHYNKGGPIGQWSFDEGSGSVAYDKTENNNDGTISGASWTTGKYGSALSFDGVDDYIQVTDANSLDITNAITISSWIKTGDSYSGTQGYIVRKGSEASGVADYGFSVSGSPGYLKFDFNNGGWQAGTVDTSKSVTDNNWHFVTMTYDKVNYTYYVDGVRGSSIPKTTAMAGTAQNLYIGNDLTAYYFNGLIDDVKIYNYVRTPEQIRLDYNAGLAAKLGPSGKDCKADPAGCMTEGLAGYWNFDERYGASVADGSGNANTGTMYGGMATTSWAKGKVGGALNFDGSDDYVDAGIGSNLDITNTITVENWIKVSNITGNKQFIRKGNSWTLWVSGSTIEWRIIDGSTSYEASQTGTISAGTWYHVVGTYDGSTIQIYVNGVADGKLGHVGDIDSDSSSPLRIGWDSSATYMNGSIDEVRIYNRALSAEEVRYHYNKGGPVAQWKFDDGEGTTAFDSTSNNNDGTMYYMSTSTNGGWINGKYGAALSFDGVDDYIDAGGGASLQNLTNFTAEAWVKPASTPTFGNVMGKASYASGGWVMRISQNGNGRFTPHVYTDTWYTCSGSVISLNVWSHLVVRYDGTTLKGFVNGVEDCAYFPAVRGNLSSNAAGTHIGGAAGETPVNLFNGLIDDVRIYNYARTQDQIRTDYNAGLNMHFK